MNFKEITWYLAYVVQCFEYEDKRFQEEFSVWENVILINANTPEEAYEKAVNFGRLVEEEVTINGEKGYSRFKGLSDLVPIYEEIGDGAELTFKEFELQKADLEEMVLSKENLTAFKAVV